MTDRLAAGLQQSRKTSAHDMADGDRPHAVQFIRGGNGAVITDPRGVWVRHRPASKPCAPEFTGKARAFRAKLMAEEPRVFEMMRTVGDKLRQRAERNPIPRRADLEQWVRTWRLMPSTSRILLLDAGIEKKDGALTCYAIDTRLVGAAQQHESWDSDDREPCVAVVAFAQWFEAAQVSHGRIIRQARYEKLMHIRATISFHAIARCFERWTDCEYPPGEDRGSAAFAG
jgi:hypothetical protein